MRNKAVRPDVHRSSRGSRLRTGMTKVWLAGRPAGLQKEDPTTAEMLKPLGYSTGQFGRTHLGDRNEYLPTVHGFRRVLRQPLHLKPRKSPNCRIYPKSPEFRAKVWTAWGTGLKASEKGIDTTGFDPRFGKVGKQTCTDTGPLTKARMVTIDDDIADRATDFISGRRMPGNRFSFG